jgi:hypothetical protein
MRCKVHVGGEVACLVGKQSERSNKPKNIKQCIRKKQPVVFSREPPDT